MLSALKATQLEGLSVDQIGAIFDTFCAQLSADSKAALVAASGSVRRRVPAVHLLRRKKDEIVKIEIESF